ncbi:MAG: 50S ribosomal protein L5 [Elusimicrobiota bacterium]|nr:50S ribosomal protein L5 [Endomicrobiia bacterium]MDW8165498.1 50S ribosomal protein L5 [Elusimicrobiota bacterium]
MPRLKKLYKEVILPQLMKKLNYKNIHQVPKLEKVVISMSVNEAKENIKALDIAMEELSMITGQKPKICRAKKAISNFKIKKGMPIGLKVTLRGDRMYEFIDRLIYIALPKIKDFHGISPDGFDGRGNYNLGITEQYIFPEVSVEKSDRVRGMNITIVTSAKTDQEAKELLSLFGFPFRKN